MTSTSSQKCENENSSLPLKHSASKILIYLRKRFTCSEIELIEARVHNFLADPSYSYLLPPQTVLLLLESIVERKGLPEVLALHIVQ